MEAFIFCNDVIRLMQAREKKCNHLLIPDKSTSRDSPTWNKERRETTSENRTHFRFKVE